MHPRASVEYHQHVARRLGFTTREVTYDDGEVMVDIEGFGELVELYYRPSKTGYLAFRRAFIHVSNGGGDRIPTWKRTDRMLYTISTTSGRCDHFETDTQPGDCEECVCGDCGAWVGSAEIRRNAGDLCDKCVAAELDEDRDDRPDRHDRLDWGDED